MRAMLYVTAILVVCYMTTVEGGWLRRNRGISNGISHRRRFVPDTRRTYNPRRIIPDSRYRYNTRTWRNKRSDDLSELCEFMTYDADENGEVILGEFRDVYGENEMAFDLFMNLDSDGSGAIEEAEFYQQAPTFIDECADIASDDEK